jgi:hypothetical protein
LLAILSNVTNEPPPEDALNIFRRQHSGPYSWCHDALLGVGLGSDSAGNDVCIELFLRVPRVETA